MFLRYKIWVFVFSSSCGWHLRDSRYQGDDTPLSESSQALEARDQGTFSAKPRMTCSSQARASL